MTAREKTEKVDVSKFTDFEISMLVVERDTAQFRAERIDELLNKVGQARGLVEAQEKKWSWNPDNVKWGGRENDVLLTRRNGI